MQKYSDDPTIPGCVACVVQEPGGEPCVGLTIFSKSPSPVCLHRGLRCGGRHLTPLLCLVFIFMLWFIEGAGKRKRWLLDDGTAF